MRSQEIRTRYGYTEDYGKITTLTLRLPQKIVGMLACVSRQIAAGRPPHLGAPAFSDVISQSHRRPA
jgi:hypothetical protein